MDNIQICTTALIDIITYLTGTEKIKDLERKHWLKLFKRK